uniref:Pyridoxamine-phosphate oxidase-related protein n=1 Tax=uncultured bacterium contig00018 TaxID=1181509 RepID=A0A806KMV9_9BACT|nr:pyridoxamine-phosphate oxidase-related protein [uncultured bacterium contig00018]
MFKAMRRKDRELSRDNAIEILKKGKYGIMALVGENGYPYGVPLHYALIDGDVYFHSAAEGGHKTECFAHNPKASFTVVETKNGIKARSAVIFGTIEILPDMRSTVLEKIIEKFVPSFVWKQVKKAIPSAVNNIIAYRLKTEHISAKFIDRPKKQK